MRKIALVTGVLVLTAQTCFAEFQWAADAERFIPKAKIELAALSENGRTAFRKALIACSLYADESSNAEYKDNCKVASKSFTVEFSNERNILSAMLGLAESETGGYEVTNKIALYQGQVPPMIGNPGGKAYIAALQKAYRETNFHANSAVGPSNIDSGNSKTAGPILIPLQRQGGTLIVPVLINKAITLNFVIDSGASDVSIPADVVMTLIRTGTIQDTDFIGRQTYKLADGSTVPSATFRIRSLTMNKLVIENVKGSVASAAGDLLLGQSFLARFKSWSIDNARQALVLTTQ
jgi:predicted aspartyl protease